MKKELNLGALCDAITAKREEIGALEQRLADLKAEDKELGEQMKAAMLEQGVEQVRGAKATISRSKLLFPRVTDWEKFYQFVRRNGAYHLFQRRLAIEACRDEVVARRGKELPGTETFEEVRLNVRRI